MKCNLKNRRTKTRWHLEEWGDLNDQQLRQKLLERMVSSEVVQKRYWQKVKILSDDDCWNWTGAFWPDGYGMLTATIGYYGKKWVGFRANRIAYLLHYGKLPTDLFVCHRCDNPKCVNPRHLFLGKQIHNMRDKVKKGRQAFGEKHGRSKLTVRQVQDIRRLHFIEKVGVTALTKIFPVKTSSIWSILNGQNWAWLPFDPLNDY